jgi:hypothetical protein
MMGRNALLVLGIAAAAGAAKPTHAQCRLCEKPTVEREGAAAEGIIALEVEAGIDFDRLILLGPGEGSATLKPDGSRQVSGRIGTISSRAMVGQARRVRGEPGRSVRVDLPRRIELHSLSGATIALEDIVSDLSAAPRLDSSGVLMFRFGGRLVITGDAEGDYRGDVPITVEYL